MQLLYEGSFVRVIKVNQDDYIVEGANGRDGLGHTRWDDPTRPLILADVLKELAKALDLEMQKVDSLMVAMGPKPLVKKK